MCVRIRERGGRRMSAARTSAVAATLGALLLLAPTADASHPHRPHMRHPSHGVQFDVGPVLVPKGQEITQCTYFKMPGDHDLSVGRVQIKVSGGSHHVHLYRAQDPTMNVPDHSEACNFALDFSVWQLVLASQQLYLDWRLPPGVAFFFKAGEQLAAQTHFVDSGLLHTPSGKGWAVMNLHAMPRNHVTAYAGAFFGQDRDVVVPPHSTSTATTNCVFPKPVSLLAITGHYHYRGVHFTAGTWDGHTGTQIYAYDGYLDPAFVRFNDSPPIVPGLTWTCTYDNPTDDTFTFGPFTDKNEHCNLFAFYYPTSAPEEDITCVQKDSQVTVTVHDRTDQ
jgi:hypothetical protein